jgi:6-pyruvoyl-tetrahydropterin synthase related domain
MTQRLRAAIGFLGGPAIILFAALFSVAPEIARGSSCGHDYDFHLVSWFDALASWHQGVFYPHWTPSPNYEAGEPRFIFYPPLTWMLGAALGEFISWKFVSVALTWILLAGAGLAAYALARMALPRGPSTLAGCVALFSGYSLFNAYERTAFGELTGGIWIPLLLLFVLRDRKPDAPLLQRAFDGSAALLALMLAGAWFSDIPLGVMASYFLLAVAVTSALLKGTWAPLLRAASAAVLGIGLTSIYLIPAIVQQKWVDVHEATSDPGTRIEDSWLFERHSDPSLDQHDLELFRVSVVGSTVILAAMGSLLIAWKRKRLPGPRAYWIPLALIPAVVLLLQFPISLPVWNLLPKMHLLQFPWRWLVTVQAPMGILFASALWVQRSWLRRLTYAAYMFLAFSVTVFAGLNLFQSCFPEDAPWTMADDFAAHVGFEGTDEYTPEFADNSFLALGLPPSCLTSSATTTLGAGSAGTTLEWKPEQGSCLATFPLQSTGRPSSEHLRVDFDAPLAGFLVVRLRSYPAWRIVLSGRVLTHLPERIDGLIVVPVNAGRGDLRIDWTLFPSDIVARWISALVLALLCALFVAERRAAPPRL